MRVSGILHAGGPYETQPLTSTPSIDREGGRWGAVFAGASGGGGFSGEVGCGKGQWLWMILILTKSDIFLVGVFNHFWIFVLKFAFGNHWSNILI